MTGATKTEVSKAGFSPHIEELHEFFRSRGVAFGKPEDLTGFAERLTKDESFRDEMASMMRAIIYRERDGLMPAELMELLVTAVAGAPAEAGQEQVSDSARQIMKFAAGVFRSRWNPGGSVAVTQADVGAEVATAAVTAPGPAEAASRPMTPIFYQAQVVAKGGEEPEALKPLDVAKKPGPVEEPEAVLPLRGTSEPGGGPTLSLAGYATRTEPVVAFLRGDGAREGAPYETERKRSSGWAWTAAIVAILIAFCAGMYVRQWMIPRYGPAWPWHLPASWKSIPKPTPPAAGTSGGATPPPGSGAVSTPSGTAVQPRKPAQVEAARSAWNGGAESALDLEPGDAASRSDPARSAPGGTGGREDAAAGSNDASTPQPMAGPDAGVRAKALRSAQVTAMVGASPSLMASHLLFAPEPEYPSQAKIAHIQGPVLVQALVGRDGSVVRAQAISGDRLLRVAAEEAVYGRRYRPYVVDGVPMAVRTLVAIDFRLR